MSRGAALFCLLLTAVLWSSGGLLIKSVNWHPLAIAGGRGAIATFVLLLVFRKSLRFHFDFLMWGAALSYAATTILFVLATRLTTAANAILLQYTAPLYVALFGTKFLGERATRLDWSVLFIALGGMTLFFFEQLSTQHLIGNIVAVASGVSFAGIAIFLRKQRNRSTIEPIIIGNAIAALLVLPFLSGGLPTGSSALILVILGVFQLALPYLLYSKAIRHVTALEATFVTFIEPILNPLWVFLWMGEKPGTLSLLGGGIVLGAVAVGSVSRSLTLSDNGAK